MTAAIRRAAFPLLVLAAAAGAACATSGTAVPSPFPRPGGWPGAAGAPAAGDRAAVVHTALGFLGVPYRTGGSDPAGFDCSGLVSYVFGLHGRRVPRTSAEQYAAGRRVGRTLQPGDLVFFSTIAPGPSHVGIVVSPDEFVHAPASTGVVRVERLSASYWASRYVGARRLD